MSFSAYSSILPMVIDKAVKKFWFMLNDSPVIMAVDVWLRIIVGAVSSRSPGHFVNIWNVFSCLAKLALI